MLHDCDIDGFHLLIEHHERLLEICANFIYHLNIILFSSNMHLLDDHIVCWNILRTEGIISPLIFVKNSDPFNVILLVIFLTNVLLISYCNCTSSSAAILVDEFQAMPSNVYHNTPYHSKPTYSTSTFPLLTPPVKLKSI